MAPIATLTVRISAQIAELQTAFKDASKVTKDFADNFEGIATRAAAVGSFLGNIAADMAKAIARSFGSMIRDAIKFSQDFQNAFLGLRSVAGPWAWISTRRPVPRRLSADGLLAQGCRRRPQEPAHYGLTSIGRTSSWKCSKIMRRSAGKIVVLRRRGAQSGGRPQESISAVADNGDDQESVGPERIRLQARRRRMRPRSRPRSRRSIPAWSRESITTQGDAARMAKTFTGQLTRRRPCIKRYVRHDRRCHHTERNRHGRDPWRRRCVPRDDHARSRQSGHGTRDDAVIFWPVALGHHQRDRLRCARFYTQVGANNLFTEIAQVGIALFKFQEKAANTIKYLIRRTERQRGGAGSEGHIHVPRGSDYRVQSVVEDGKGHIRSAERCAG